MTSLAAAVLGPVLTHCGSLRCQLQFAVGSEIGRRIRHGAGF